MKAILSQLIDDFHERDLPDLVPRDRVLPEIQGKADVVIGMRRTGKTWFCYQRMKELLTQGVRKEEILYINFEDDRLLEFNVSNFQDILDVYFVKNPGCRNDRCWFFFDEIQRVDHWERFIRRMLDTETIQICITGSSSKLLSYEIATSLRGRSLTVEMLPFSFIEFLRCHGLFNETPKTFGVKTSATLRKAMKEYFEIGGFPEVQHIDPGLRIEVLQSYIDSVLLKDIIERHQIANVTALKHLIRHVMHSAGGKFSVNKFYNTMKSMSIKCAKNNLYEYLDHLTDAFLFSKVPIHSRSEKVRTINPAKYYAIDTGLLNAMTFRNSSDLGPLLETLVFIQLRRKGCYVEYATTSDGFEVDFIARDKRSGRIELIQVCWDMSDQETFKRELRGLKSAMKDFSINAGTIVTWDNEAALDKGIQALPVWKWLL